jgi:hypothetical protein
LKPHGFERVEFFKELAPYWSDRLVPKDFPHKGNLLRRVPVPMFFDSREVSLAVHSAGSDSQISTTVGDTLQVVLPAPPDAVGIILDADSTVTPAARFKELYDELSQLKLGLNLPAQAGAVSTGTPRCGIFVLPDNLNPGTLEDLLLECAALNYPGLLTAAQALVAQAQAGASSLTKEDLKDFRKPTGRKKATVAGIASVLRPGKAVQTSIQDNRWLEAQALSLPRILTLRQFLKDLLALP